jgi:alpha,alpha-trehalose-phosphate synthase [UDP-forming]
MADRFDFVVVANRLPVDRRDEPDGSVTWLPSPGGLVAAMEPVLRGHRGAWVGWTGSEGEAPPPFDASEMHLVAVPLSAREIADYYEGMSNGTLWPLYHDVIAPPRYHRRWWDSYLDVNRRFADVTATQAAQGATVWVQDYQLQLVPRLLRDVRPDLRIGFFNHIPFPPYELFAQLPWRRQVLDGLLGADLVGFQRPADANNFLRACRRVGLVSRRGHVRAPGLGGERLVRAQAFPISVDAASIGEIARRPEVLERAREIRAELGSPELVLLGVDRLDYTKGILHRLQAVEELFADQRLKIPGTVFVQVATPSRERVESYKALREEVETTVGRINGEHARLGHPAVHYLHQSFPKEELVALYLAADVLLVTALRDGMNLVAKEYIASRHDERGALVLSEFTGASTELLQAYIVNPHDIEGVKGAVVRAASASPRESARRMRTLRKRVFGHDVGRWAGDFLRALDRSAATNAHLAEPSPLDAMDQGPPAPDLAAAPSVTTRGTATFAEEEQLSSDADLADPGALLADTPVARRQEPGDR